MQLDITQVINITVNDPITPPGVPETGFGGIIGLLTGSTNIAGLTIPNQILFAATGSLIAAIIALILALKHRKKASINALLDGSSESISTVLKNKMLQSQSKKYTGPIIAFVSVIAIVALVISRITVTNASSIPDLTISENMVNLTIEKSNATSGSFTSASSSSEVTVTTRSGSPGYELFAISDNNDSNIIPALIGGDLTVNTNIPSSYNTGSPMLIKSFSGEASSGDTTDFTLTITVDNSIPAGTYTIELTYLAEVDEPAPTITSISPTSGPTTGGTTMTITGTNFGTSTTPFIENAYLGGTQGNNWSDGLECTNLTVIDSTTATCITPTSVTGTVDFSVSGPFGWDSLSGAYTYIIPFTITLVALDFGRLTGSDSITIYGTNFTSDATASIGGVSCLSTTYISTSTLNCVTPPNTAGTKDVSVTTTAGTGTLTNGFTYMASSGNIQDLSSTACSSLTVGNGIILTDARDNKQYRVKKMPDNKCWMVDNLTYIGGGTNTYGDVVPTGSSGAGVLVAGNGTTSVVSSNWTNSTGTTTRYYTNTSTDYVFSSTACVSTATGATVMTSACGNQILYNWCAAVGIDSATTPTCAAATNTGFGTGYVEQTSGGSQAGIVGKANGIGGESKGNGVATNQAGVNSSTVGSICPAGWRLPSGRVGSANTNVANNYNEWILLMYSLNTGSNFPNTSIPATPGTSFTTNYMGYFQPAGTSIGAGTSAAFGTVSAGMFNTGLGLYSQSTGAYWWASSLGSSTNAANVFVSSSGVNPGTSTNSKSLGFAVRCVFP